MIYPLNLSLPIVLLLFSAYAITGESRTDNCPTCNTDASEQQSAGMSLTPEIDIAFVANSKTWQRLIYLDKKFGRWRSDIKDTDFYLSNSVELTPVTELLATLTAFSEPISQGDDHAICRYPARYQWLATAITNLRTLPKPTCSNLSRWLEKSKGFPVNVIHVSGYFGNPASAFGHLLLRIGSVEDSKDRGLSDTGVNFGARIPSNENTISYILKGIFGGYSASFTDQPHYVQDLVYSGIESRDMWNYQLDLNSDQRSLLVHHLWEVRRIPFSYYFLSKNCAYRIAQILELVLDINFIHKPTLYYLPVDVFYKLDDIDTNAKNEKTVRNITFIPSKKRELLIQYANLSSEQRKYIGLILKNDNTTSEFSKITDAGLDFLNQYVDFLLVAAIGQARENMANLKDRLLLARLNRPPANTSQSIPIDSPPPEPGGGQRARVISIANNTDDHSRHRLEVTFSPYSFELLNNNRGSLTHSSFKVLETKIGIDTERTQLEQLEFIAIERYAEPSYSIDGQFRTPLSWRAALSYTEPLSCADNCGRLETLGSIGLASPLLGGLAHGLVDSRVNLTEGDIALGITGGIRWSQGNRLNYLVRSSIFKYVSEGMSQTTHRLSARFRPKRDQAITLSISNRPDSRLKIAYDIRW